MSTGATGRGDSRGQHRLPGKASRAEGTFSEAFSETLGETMGALGEHARTATSVLDERTGVVTLIRKNPLAACGIAFATGAAIAALSARPSDRRWIVERARRQLRTAILSGLTAAVTAEIRSVIGDDLAQFVMSFSGRTGGEDADIEYDEEIELEYDDVDDDDIFDR
ncbi:MAG: hypothetical protein LBG44_05555 [Gemmatimonadota bacterium]|jgi:hypothetical protein|nr:hypothetical protein [Gemmatimonadota bacterium]